jgi:hypothetical protein
MSLWFVAEVPLLGLWTDIAACRLVKGLKGAVPLPSLSAVVVDAAAGAGALRLYCRRS